MTARTCRAGVQTLKSRLVLCVLKEESARCPDRWNVGCDMHREARMT